MSKTKTESSFSENEDDPEVYESSGDEWNDEDKKRPAPKRTPRAKKQKVQEEFSSEEVEDEEEIEDEEEVEDEESDSDDEQKKKNGKRSGEAYRPKINKVKTVPAVEGSEITNTSFMNGGFVVLKKDVQQGDKPCLWRVDGKALLQKYEVFEEEGKVKHRNTSVYTGWTSLDVDLYYPVTVKVLQHQGQNMVVELNWEKLKELQNASE